MPPIQFKGQLAIQAIERFYDTKGLERARHWKLNLEHLLGAFASRSLSQIEFRRCDIVSALTSDPDTTSHYLVAVGCTLDARIIKLCRGRTLEDISTYKRRTEVRTWPWDISDIVTNLKLLSPRFVTFLEKYGAEETAAKSMSVANIYPGLDTSENRQGAHRNDNEFESILEVINRDSFPYAQRIKEWLVNSKVKTINELDHNIWSHTALPMILPSYAGPSQDDLARALHHYIKSPRIKAYLDGEKTAVESIFPYIFGKPGNATLVDIPTETSVRMDFRAAHGKLTANWASRHAIVDLHIDGVMETVSVGNKLWFLLPFTDHNLQLYQRGNRLKDLHKFEGAVILRTERTIYIPAGCIHATITIEAGFLTGFTFVDARTLNSALLCLPESIRTQQWADVKVFCVCLEKALIEDEKQVIELWHKAKTVLASKLKVPKVWQNLYRTFERHGLILDKDGGLTSDVVRTAKPQRL